MSDIDLESLVGQFFEEAEEHLASMETTLLALEAAPGDRALLDTVFRAAHSIKGGCGAFGFAHVLRFTHALENLLQRLREGSLTLTPELADLLLRSKDTLADLLAAARSNGEPPAAMGDLLEEIEWATPAKISEAETDPAYLAALAAGGCIFSSAPPAQPARAEIAVRFAPGINLLREGMDPLLAVKAVTELGEARRVEIDTTALPALDALDPTACHLAWTVSLVTSESEERVRDAFAFVEGSSVVEVTRAHASPAPVAPVIATPAVAPEAPHDAPPADPSPPREAPATVIANAASEAKGDPAAGATHATVRVDTDKIDKLMNLVGELVIAHSMVTSAMNDTSPDALERMREAVGAIGRNTRELQDRVMAVRMVAIGTVLNRFPRMVRDIASKLDKKINLVVVGQETELDKALVERLVDPLTHLIRNAVDHGIEAPAERLAAGKPEIGTVTILARHQGGSVLVEVRDDGRGLQLARIREKAIAMGLLPEGAEPTEEEIHALIFAPGFSTAQSVSDVSGRGVGMDVVKRNVESLNGTLHFTSEPGRGSCMSVRLPLTMAIIDGLSVRIGDQIFVIPLTSVVESFRPSREQVHAVFGAGEVVRVRGQPLSLVRPDDVLGVKTQATDACSGIACILDAGTARVGLLVDELLGQVQAVVKTIETNYRRVTGVMGATILGDGSVALILDVSAIGRRAVSGAGKEKDNGPVGRVA